MKKFKYSLEKVLRTRQICEEEAKKEFARLVLEYEKLKKQKLTLDDKLHEIQSRIRQAKMKDKLVISQLLEDQAYSKYISMQSRDLLSLLKKGENYLHESRKKMMLARANRKVLDKHREDKERQYYIQCDKKEEQEIESILLGRFESLGR